MEIETQILDFVKSKKKKQEVHRLRGLVKTGENEWTFHYTFRDGDYLSLSTTQVVKSVPTLTGLKFAFKRKKANKKQPVTIHTI